MVSFFGIGKFVADFAARRGLCWRIGEALADHVLLIGCQIVAGRCLGGGEADAAEDRKGDCACANKVTHDCPLMSWGS
jgi:hypothetical protein